MKHAGLNKADLMMVDPTLHPNYIIMSEDRIAMFNNGTGKGRGPEGFDEKGLDRSGNIIDLFTCAVSVDHEVVKVNRRVLIQMLQMMSSENVVIKVREDYPLVLQGETINGKCQGVIAPIIEEEY